MKLPPRLLAAASAVALSAAAAPAFAGAFYIQEQSVKGLGRAYSGEAADTGVDSLWWNPAAIAQIDGVQTYTGVHSVYVTGELRDRGSTISRPAVGATTPVGGQPYAYNPVLFGVVPNSGFGWRVNDRIAVGVAVTAPYNFTTKYESASWVRYDALKSRLLSIDIQPTVALHVTRWLDLGVGFDAEYVDSTLTNALPNLSPLLPDGQQRLSGDGWDYGWTAGAQLHPTDRLSIGLSYRSDIEHTLDGQVTANPLPGTPLAAALAVNAPGTAKFTTPWMATVSARYRLTDKLTVNAQAQRIGWSKFDAINVAYGAVTTSTPENYQDVTTGSIGLDYEVNPKWTLRTGVEYDPTPTRNGQRSARVPDGDRVLFGLGTTVKVTPRLSFDLAGAYIHFEDSALRYTDTPFAGTALATPVNLVGDITGEGAILSAGAHYRF